MLKSKYKPVIVGIVTLITAHQTSFYAFSRVSAPHPGQQDESQPVRMRFSISRMDSPSKGSIADCAENRPLHHGLLGARFLAASLLPARACSGPVRLSDTRRPNRQIEGLLRLSPPV